MTATVRLANAGDIAPLSASLSRAFFDDPVMNFLLGTKDLPFDKGVKFFTLMSKMQLPHEHSYVTDQCEAVAIWAPPDKWKVPSIGDPEGDARLPQRLRCSRSSCPRSKRSTCSRRTTRRNRTTTSSSSAPIPPHQRKGLGGAVHGTGARAKCDTEGVGAYLESSKDVNVPYYRHFGFEVRQEITHKNDGSEAVAHVARPEVAGKRPRG